jgi:phage baseplate assembly protein W
MEEDNSFLGIGWAFPPAFDPKTKSVRMVAAETDIEQSLRILMGTTPAERVMQSSYGCNLRRLLFGVVNESALSDLRDTIERAVRLFEPRIILDRVEFDDSGWLEGVLKVVLVYTVISTNTRNNLVFPLYLREGTSVGFEA